MPKSLAIAYQMKRKAKKHASQDSAKDKEMSYDKGEACPTCGTMKMSHGGKVANDTGEGASADEKPNEFDYLVLNDDLEDSDTASNSGDEIGGPDKDDLVAKAMLKRKKRS